MGTGTVNGTTINILSRNATHFIVGVLKDDGTAGTSQTVSFSAGL